MTGPRYGLVAALEMAEGTIFEPLAARLIDREADRLERMVEAPAPKRSRQAVRLANRKAQAAFQAAYQQEKARNDKLWAEIQGIKAHYDALPEGEKAEQKPVLAAQIDEKLAAIRG